MSVSGRTELGRIVCYDNVAVGSAVGSKERTIAGALPPVKIVGGGEGTAGANQKGHSNIAKGSNYPTANIPDDIAVGVVTLAGENVAVGG
jgi:hypothetical protein